MAKKTLFKLGNISTDKNDDVGFAVIYDYDGKWHTTEEVEQEYKDYIKNQESWKYQGLNGRYFITVTEVKVIDMCPHCGEELESDITEVM